MKPAKRKSAVKTVIANLKTLTLALVTSDDSRSNEGFHAFNTQYQLDHQHFRGIAIRCGMPHEKEIEREEVARIGLKYER